MKFIDNKTTLVGNAQQLERLYNRASELVNDLRDELEILKSKFDKLEPKEENKYKRWRADEGKEYYFINSIGDVTSNIDNGTEVSTFRYMVGNYFKTEEEAKEYIENLKTKQELKDLALELNKGQKIDWEDKHCNKYYIYYDGVDDVLNIDEANIFQDLGQVYCLDEDFLKIAIERIGEQRLIKLIKSGV